jgi:hypothetical protein
MANETKAGFFNIETIQAVCDQTDLAQAKQIALQRIAETKRFATSENIYKATHMVEHARTVRNLGIAMSNFMLAHPSEGLKTIR